jgi:hypothetical protein
MVACSFLALACPLKASTHFLLCRAGHLRSVELCSVAFQVACSMLSSGSGGASAAGGRRSGCSLGHVCDQALGWWRTAAVASRHAKPVRFILSVSTCARCAPSSMCPQLCHREAVQTTLLSTGERGDVFRMPRVQKGVHSLSRNLQKAACCDRARRLRIYCSNIGIGWRA